jgi:phage-related protein (TIGR01555 family)
MTAKPRTTPTTDAKRPGLQHAVAKARIMGQRDETGMEPYLYVVKAPDLPKGVLPADQQPAWVAMDSGDTPFNFLYLNQAYPGAGFPGYTYLAMLTTRPEYRSMASALSTEVTREWIEFTSKEDDDTGSAERIKRLEELVKEHKLQALFQVACQNDCFFGRAQLLVKIKGADLKVPLVLSERTIAKNSFEGVSQVEAIWTSPSAYNALDPSKPDFYKPSTWFMLGQEVHASRLMTIITRPLPDILKPAFNFSGMSLSQLAEPYVNNWLRTRQSVADLINMFSTTALKTSMSQVLQSGIGGTAGAEAADSLMNRAELFTLCRTNKGLMLLDNDSEDLVQINTPLSGLGELQEQSQLQMSTVSRIPSVILTGITPSGLNASSDGDIRVFYDWIKAQQEAYWRDPLEIILKVMQLSEFGIIDPNIDFVFKPLYQMTPKDLAEIRRADAETDNTYVSMGAISNEEVRDKLAKDPISGYDGIDVSDLPELPEGDDIEPEDEDGEAD